MFGRKAYDEPDEEDPSSKESPNTFSKFESSDKGIISGSRLL